MIPSIIYKNDFTCIGTISYDVDGDEKIHVSRKRLEFVCTLFKRNGRTIDQEEIGEFILNDKLIFKVMDKDESPISLSHEVDYVYNKIFYFVNEGRFIQSVEYNYDSISLNIVLQSSTKDDL